MEPYLPIQSVLEINAQVRPGLDEFGGGGWREQFLLGGLWWLIRYNDGIMMVCDG